MSSSAGQVSRLLVLVLVLSRNPQMARLCQTELVCEEGEIDSIWIGHTGFGVDTISNLLPISDENKNGRPPLSKANQILLMIPFPLPHCYLPTHPKFHWAHSSAGTVNHNNINIATERPWRPSPECCFFLFECIT